MARKMFLFFLYFAILHCSPHAAAQGCKETEILTAGSTLATIQSPGYPGNYENNLDCTWIINAPAGNQILLRFTDVDTEECCDYIEVKDGSTVLEVYRGSTDSDISMFSVGEQLTIRFYADNNTGGKSHKGFQATYISAQNCGTRLNAGSDPGYFSTPGYPDLYPHNLDCVWTIRSADAPHVQVKFLESTTASDTDYIEVYDGINRLGHIAGSSFQQSSGSFTSLGDKLSVYFHSDGNGNAKGFRAIYKEGECGGDHVITDFNTHTVVSPGYPYSDNDVNCTFTFEANAGNTIEMNINVDTEEGYDFVKVYDGTTELGYISGKRDDQYFTSRTKSISLHYYTDSSEHEKGFNATFRQKAPKCPTNTWTNWFDRDNPSGLCDCENLQNLRNENPGAICEVPTDFEARIKTSQVPYNPFLPNIQASATFGLRCNNGLQRCDDYEIRFCCPPAPVPDIGTCTASGDPHYTTFDGQRYDFMGTCSYTLVQHISTNAKVPSFQIEVENTHRYGNTRVSYLDKLIVRIGKKPIITLQGKNILVGSKPYKINSFLFHMITMSFNGISIHFKSTFGLEFLYDQKSLIRVKLPKAYAENVQGLCGNFNGIRKDDMQHITSKQHLNAVEFANQFQTDTKKGCAAAQPPINEECQADKLVDYTARCSVMNKRNACFAACPIDSTPFIQDCIFDACAFDDAEDALDQNVGAYAVKCQSEGYEICDWRSITKTQSNQKWPAFICPSNSHYEVCTSRCPETCASPITDILPCNETSCTEGCKCDDGFILSDQECVPTSNCGCNVDGTYYKASETFYNDTTCTSKCTCQDGILSCRDSPCNDGEQCDASKDICVPISHSTGTAMGDPHYMTFDGSGWYDFYGSCAYTLSETHQLNSKDSQWFSIEAQNEHRRGNTRVSYLQHITVKLSNGDLVARIEKNRVIKVNGKVVQGYNTPQLTIGPSGAATVLTTQHGVQVSFDGNAVRVTLPSTYRGKVRGMLGNYNGIKEDDLEMKSGELTTDYNELALSYQVGLCPNSENLPFVCSESDKQKWNAADYCGLLSSNSGAFAACHGVVELQSFQKKCVIDVCANKGNRKTLEVSLQTYASECQARGVQLCNWRDATGFTNIQCPVNSHHGGCATPCPDTCQTPLASASCSATHTVEDCVCNPGYIRDGDRCVRKSECGTTKDGAYTSKGAAKLPVISYCSATGDPHYKTFDRKSFNFMGTCSYILAQDSTRDQPSFVVEVDNEFRNGNTRVSWLRKVYIRIPKLPTIELLKGRRVKLNNKEINPTYNTKDISIYLGSRFLVVKTSFGLQVEYDGNHYLRIGLPKSFAEKVEGLCGNYNGNPGDDFKDRASENIIGNAVTFANQYQTTTKKECAVPNPETIPDCPKKIEFNKQCSILTDRDGCFSDCHASVDATTYFENCLFDACEYNDAMEALESHVAAYSKECQDLGANICDWRAHTNTSLVCQANSHYSLCGSRCPATCGSVNPTCSNLCEEGCVCDEGFFLSGDDCVPLTECGCNDNDGIYYKAGDTFYKDDTCVKKCTCLNGTLSCSNEACGNGEECGKNKMGETDCVPTGSATAVAYGDPHYKTFDQSRFYHFMGICTYTMVETYKLKSTDPKWFMIKAKNEHRNGKTHVSYLQYVDVKLLNGKIVVRLEQNGKFRVNGRQVQQYSKSDITIQPSGRSVVLKTKFGVFVKFGNSRLTVTLPSTYLGMVRGVFGKYNGDGNNDLETKSGEIVTDFQQLAESYVVGTCSDETTPVEECSKNDKLKWGGPNFCGALTSTSGPFATCHNQLDAAGYLETCIFDVCATEGNIETLEKALQSYVSACQERGVQLCNWKVYFGFNDLQCPSNSQFNGCASPCPNTCPSPFASEKCDIEGYIEDCVCNFGFIRDGDKCIRKAECGREIDGIYDNNQECGKSLTAGETFEVITSLAYPDSYPNNLDCEWAISAPDGYQVLLTVTDLNTEFCCDYLEIFDGFESRGLFKGEAYINQTILSTSGQMIVKFHSDKNVAISGFKAFYKQVKECGSKIAVEPGLMHLSTPNYPTVHTEHLDCYWKLFSDNNKRIELNILEGQLDPSNAYIDIASEKQKIDRIKTSVISPSRFVSNSFQIYFHSENALSQSGFLASFREIDCGEFYQLCGSTSNSISSPKAHAHDRDCSYDLQAEQTFRIEMTLDVATEECCDYVEVFDGSTSLRRIKGNVSKTVITSSGNKLGLVYHTNDDVDSKGFTATYRQVCRQDYMVNDSKYLTISSPNYPSDSPHNTDCDYNLQVENGFKVELKLLEFHTESCCDYVKIFDDDKLIAFLRGNKLPQTLISKSNIMRLHYHTDSSIGSNGFKMQYSQSP